MLTYVVRFYETTLEVECYSTSEEEARASIGRWYPGRKIKEITRKNSGTSAKFDISSGFRFKKD